MSYIPTEISPISNILEEFGFRTVHLVFAENNLDFYRYCALKNLDLHCCVFVKDLSNLTGRYFPPAHVDVEFHQTRNFHKRPMYTRLLDDANSRGMDFNLLQQETDNI